MGAEQKIGAVADRLSDLSNKGLGTGKVLERELARIEHRIATDRIELDRVKSPVDLIEGTARGEVGIGIDAGFGVTVLRVENRCSRESVHVPVRRATRRRVFPRPCR